MKAAVCTLFEGDYHKGVGVLINSLIHHGFRGTVFAGFRGLLPPWTKRLLEPTAPHPDPQCQRFAVTDSVNVVFVSLAMSGHLTNRKPDFMLRILEQSEPDLGALLYLDPDIVINHGWRFFEEWLTCGVAVCEDINSPLYENSPHRVGWRRFYESVGIALRFRSDAYANGGLVGVRKQDVEFLKLWARLQEAMFRVTGGPAKAGIAGGESVLHSAGFADCFLKTDQDALNATIEAWDGPVSVLDQKAMGFALGTEIVPHALGPRKPWRTNPVSEALAGRGCSAADKAFWANCDGPIVVFSRSLVSRRKMEIKVASFIGRFYGRS
jgi:hypothetical protein